jgi:ABC-2 type transport system ATP-binding protein
MSSLLRRLHTETFVINLRDPIAAVPLLEGYLTTLVDDRTLEIEVSKEQNLNEIFSRLSALGIEVVSMRNKVNRLEEIFMRLVEGRHPHAPGALPATAAGGHA